MSENIENIENEAVSEQDLQTPENNVTEANSTIDKDEDFVSELLDKIDKRLEKKLYYGRKQEKVDRKSQKKLEKLKEQVENENTIFYFASGILFLVGCVVAFFGFKALKREQNNENS